MKLVLLPEVAIAAARRADPSHEVARARLERAIRGVDRLVLPTLFFVEVTAALARAGVAGESVSRLLDGLTQPPHRVVTLGPRRAALAASMAMKWKLDANVAVYASLAAAKDIALCALTDSLAERAAGELKVVLA